MSGDEIAIRVNNLSKCYKIFNQPHDRLKHSVYPRLQKFTGLPVKQYFREFWALRDVTFEVRKGETVGIVGRNGSGKSTLLQMICGTLAPTSGEVETNGRIAALLELGSGFNPEFTGRENVFMNGAILGLSQEEIESRFDDIATFADIGQFIEQPVKTYSSGMFVRLAFAVNVMSQPEIMVVDEALAVGDMNFQAKCMTALKRIQENGATILFVSHDIGSVKSLCSRAVYLEKGEVMGVGPAPEVSERYIRMMREELNKEHSTTARRTVTLPEAVPRLPSELAPTPEFVLKASEAFGQRVAQFRYGSSGARIEFAELLDSTDQPVVSAEFNQRVKVKIYFTVSIETNLSVNYYIQDNKKNLILGAWLSAAGESLLHCSSGTRYIVTYTTSLPLQEGHYSIQLQLTRPVVKGESAEFLDVVDDAIVFNVQRRSVGRIWSKVYLPNSVEIAQRV